MIPSHSANQNAKLRSLRARRDDGGFTLVEVLVVAIILGILAGIAVLAFSGASRYSTRRACETDVKTVVGAISAYRNDWPTTTDINYSDGLKLYGASELVPTYMSPLSATSPYKVSKFTIKANSGFSITLTKDTLTSDVTDESGISTACSAVIQ